MEWFIAVVIVAALGAAAVAAAGGLGGMAKEPVRDVYRQDLPTDRPLSAADISALRFGTALRGYAMGQVDDVLDRLAREIAERDALIAELRAADRSARANQEPDSDLRDNAAEPDADPTTGPTAGPTAASQASPDEVSADLR
jgi:DivIVA domain-containing protein